MSIVWDDLFGHASTKVNFLGSNQLSVYTTAFGGAAGIGTFLPADNALVLGLVFTSETSAAGTFYWNDPGTYDFTQVSGSPFTITGSDALLRQLYVFWAFRSTWGATAYTASFDCTGDPATGARVSVIQLTGVSNLGTIVQELSAENQSSANPALTLSPLSGSNNAVVAAFVSDVNPFVGTSEAGWTEGYDAGYASPNTGAYITYQIGVPDNTVLVTSAAANWAGWAVEIKDAGFQPTSIAGCKAWWDFSDISTLYTDDTFSTPLTTDGEVIGGVLDKSVADNTLAPTTTNGPAYKTSIINGLSVARFDGTNDDLLAAMIADDSWTLFITARKRSVVGTAPKPLFSVGSGNASVFTDLDIGSGYSYDLTEASTTIALGGTPTGISIIALRINSTSSMNGYINGVAFTTFDPNNTVTQAANYYLGTDTATFGDFDVGEVIAYDSALSLADLNTIGNYLATKWGSSWAAPVSGTKTNVMMVG